MSEEIEIPSVETVPQTYEGIEAYQNTINKVREKAVSEMTETEQLKMKTIEEAISILEKNGVEFFLFANPRDGNKRQFWHFNKLEYSTEDEISFAELERRVKEKVWGRNGVYWRLLLQAIAPFKTPLIKLCDEAGNEKLLLNLRDQKIFTND